MNNEWPTHVRAYTKFLAAAGAFAVSQGLIDNETVSWVVSAVGAILVLVLPNADG